MAAGNGMCECRRRESSESLFSPIIHRILLKLSHKYVTFVKICYMEESNLLRWKQELPFSLKPSPAFIVSVTLQSDTLCSFFHFIMQQSWSFLSGAWLLHVTTFIPINMQRQQTVDHYQPSTLIHNNSSGRRQVCTVIQYTNWWGTQLFQESQL
jgi:hypothetical protein